MPARWAARQRRSPATISKPSPLGRTIIGCNTPFSRSDVARDAISSSAKCRRGLLGLACKSSIAKWRSPTIEPGGARLCAGIETGLIGASTRSSPIKAARPRPSLFFCTLFIKYYPVKLQKMVSVTNRFRRLSNHVPAVSLLTPSGYRLGNQRNHDHTTKPAYHKRVLLTLERCEESRSDKPYPPKLI
jgi:hypothetical protein